MISNINKTIALKRKSKEETLGRGSGGGATEKDVSREHRKEAKIKTQTEVFRIR